MDGSKNGLKKSLRRDIQNGIIITTFIYILLASVVIGFIAFYEAKDQQDELLQELSKIAMLSDQDSIQKSHFNYSKDEFEEETIIIQKGYSKNAKASDLFDSSMNLHGLSDIVIKGIEWRVYAVKDQFLNPIFIAQSTEVRDEIAINNCLSLIFPSFFLMILMILFINIIIKNRFAVLNNAALDISKNSSDLFKSIDQTNFFIEVIPFVKSINNSISKINEFTQKQNRFIADAAHELRTPITALSILSENIENAKSDIEKLERQKLVNQGLVRLHKLVNHLLDLARLHNQNIYTTNKVSVKKIITNVISNLYPLSVSRSVEIVVETCDDFEIEDINNSLTKLIQNSIENAIKYSISNSEIIINFIATDEKIVFSVTNQSEIFEKSMVKQLWEPFYRPEGNKTEGSGLGLAICKEVASLLAGNVSLKKIKGDLVEFKFIKYL